MPVNHTRDILLSLHVLSGSFQLSLELLGRKLAIDIPKAFNFTANNLMFNSLLQIFKDFTGKIVILISIFIVFTSLKGRDKFTL